MEFLAGGMTAAAVVGLGVATRRGRSPLFYGDVLVAIALAYVLFAVMAESPRTILVESGGAAAFVAVAVAGARAASRRRAGLLVAAGLAVHGVYDVVHPAVVTNPVVPAWWPLFCGVVDLLLAGWVAVFAVESPPSATKTV
jgi:hypothetical protein